MDSAVGCSNLSKDLVSDVFRPSEAQQSYPLSLAVIFLLYLVVGLPWNLLVLGAILKERLYLQPTIILLLNLVLTDLLILMINFTVKIIAGLAGEFVFGKSDRVRCEVCRAELVVRNTADVSAILTISVIAFDRFFFIHKPFYYEKLISVKSSLVAVLVIWLLAILYSSLNIGLLQDLFVNDLLLECEWNFSKNHPNYHILSILVILLPYLFLLVCDVWVIVIVLRNIRTVYKVQKSSNKQFQRSTSLKLLNEQMKQTRKKKQFHLMQMFGGLIAASTIASLPVAILAIFSFRPVATPPKEYVIIATALFYSQVMIHPILESTLIKEIRIPILKLLSCAFCHKRGVAHFEIGGGGSDEGRCCCRCCRRGGESSCCLILKLIGTALVSHVEPHKVSSKTGRLTPSDQHDSCNQNHTPIENSGHASIDNPGNGQTSHKAEQEEEKNFEMICPHAA